MRQSQPTAASANSCVTFNPCWRSSRHQGCFSRQSFSLLLSFAPCFASKRKEGGLLHNKLGTVLVQPLVCLTVFFPGGNRHKFATATCATPNTSPPDIQTRGTKTQFHLTPTFVNKTMTTLNEFTNLSKLEGLIIKMGKAQHTIEWFRNQFVSAGDNHAFALCRKMNDVTSSKNQHTSCGFVEMLLSGMCDGNDILVTTIRSSKPEFQESDIRTCSICRNVNPTHAVQTLCQECVHDFSFCVH